MPTLEELQKQLADLQRQINALKAPVKYTNTATPYADPALWVSGADPLEWAAQNPEAGREYTVGYVDKMLGGPSQPTPDRDAGINRYMEAVGDEWLSGRFPVGSLEKADMAYLTRMQDPWYRKWQKDIWRSGIVSGQWRVVSGAASVGDAVRNDYMRDEANPELVAFVERRLRDRW